VLLPCGVRLIGAGVDATVIDGTNLNDNVNLIIGVGHDPAFPSSFSESYEVAFLTILAGPNSGVQGLATGWAKNVLLHHLKILGFGRGIGILQSLNVAIEHSSIQGLGVAAVNGCIAVLNSSFRDQLPGGHMSGHAIHHNFLTDRYFGINLNISVDTAVYDN